MRRLIIIKLWLLAGIAPLVGQQAGEPVLKADDILRMTVFGEDDLATQTRILKSGEAAFPLVGLVKVGGLTISEATAKVHELYAQDYLVAPRVSLTVDAYAQEFVSIVGSVSAPGQVPIPAAGKLDLAAALAAAGGLTTAGDVNRITLARADGRSSQHTLKSIQADGGPDLKPGDRVITYDSPYVDKTVTVRGQVRRPGMVAVPLDGRLDIVTALTLAGDFTDLANPRKITLTRGGKTTLLNFRDLTADGAQKFFLQPGDVIDVAERFF